MKFQLLRYAVRDLLCTQIVQFGQKSHAFAVSSPGLKKPTGTGPETVVTGQTGPDKFRFGPVSNRPKFKIQI